MQHLALGATLSVLAQEREDHTGVKVERIRSGPLLLWTKNEEYLKHEFYKHTGRSYVEY